MKFFTSWFNRPVTVFMILSVIIALSGSALLNLQIGPAGNQGKVAYSVILKHHGIDSTQIEKTITIPMEDALATITGIDSITSTSEYGQSRIDLVLSAGADSQEVYLLLRDEVERVYNQLPSSVQKPVIVSSSLDKKPIFVVAFTSPQMNQQDLSQYVEKEIKPAFERVEGSGEIEVGGGEIKEIHIRLKPERLAQAGLGPTDIANFIQSQDVLAPITDLTSFKNKFPVIIKGRLETLASLKGLKVLLLAPDGAEAGIRNLSAFADVVYGNREKDSLSRVNGEEKVVLYVQASGSANLVALSQALRKETRQWQEKNFGIDIILDTGKTVENSIMEVMTAIATGMVIVIFILFLFSKNLRQILLLSLLIPFSVVITCAILSLAKISVDQFILAGMAVGVGNIIDAGIVITDGLKHQLLRSANSTETYVTELTSLIPPLIASTLTTLIVLFPLFFLGDFAEGIREVAIAIGLLLSVSLFLTIIFIPPFFIYKQKPGERGKKRKSENNKSIQQIILKKLNLFFYRLFRFVTTYPVFILGGLFIFLTLAGFFIFIMGKDFSAGDTEPSIFAHVEYEAGASVQATDSRTSEFAQRIKNNISGITRVETIARRGNAEMYIHYDPAEITKIQLIPLIKQQSSSLRQGFVYIPEVTAQLGRKVELTILGDDNNLLRELAKSTAKRLQEQAWVQEVVFHFKEGPPTWVFDIDHQKAFKSGISVADLANFLRWSIYGPVALKWIDKNKELDLRVMADKQTIDSIDKIKKMTYSATAKDGEKKLIYLDTLGNITLQEEESRIYRKNRQRAVFFTVNTTEMPLDRAVTQLWSVLKTCPLPPGYAFDMDKNVIRLQEQFRILWLVLLLAVVLIFIVLAAQEESLISPLIICSTVPLSLAFPLYVLFFIGQSLTLPVLIGFIILSGMVVNNAILIIDTVRESLSKAESCGKLLPQSAKNLMLTDKEFRQALRKSCARATLIALRKRTRALFLTSATTIFGTIPLFFTNGESGGLLSVLALASFWGIIGSLVVTFLYIPAILMFFPNSTKAWRF